MKLHWTPQVWDKSQKWRKGKDWAGRKGGRVRDTTRYPILHAETSRSKSQAWTVTC